MKTRIKNSLAACVLGTLSLSAHAQVSDDVVKIGVLGDQSGMMADLSGKFGVEAVKMAVEDFGGTVLGKPIEVISADHQNKVDIGVSIARRDLQGEMKKQGRPWEIGKAFDESAPMGPIHPRSVVGTLDKGAIWLDVNGQRKQSSDISQMLWNIPESISYLSGLFELQPGDIIFTGTPEGVGAVVQGDVITGGVEGLGELRVQIA